MKRSNLLAILIIFFIWSTYLAAQSKQVNRDRYQLFMQPTENEIRIDGILDDGAWQVSKKADHFHMVLPTDEGFASSQSEVMMSYDDHQLYLAVTCYDTIPGKRPVESLRRDFSFGKNDNFIVFIDTYNDQTNGFAFGISAAGAQWDGIQADGGFVSLNWDTKWKSAVQNYGDKWVAEFAIPFKSIRYIEGATEWGINFARLDLKTGEKTSWAPVPRQFQTANLAFTGTLKWDQPLPKRKIHYSVLPYIFGKTRDFGPDSDADFQGKMGLDAKITLSTSLNLDLTINPDFSQVEVDQQQINLDRFELFFPEKRQFFLENSDLFASLGSSENRPFFSRRIGLENPVRGGARLSGKLGSRGRIGFMNIQTGTEGDISAGNFTVGIIQQQLFSRSNISFFMVNKQVTDAPLESTNTYNRVAGLDFNLASADSRWTGKFFFHQSLYEDMTSDAFTASGTLKYETPQLAISISQNYIGDDYRAEVGFVRRTGVFQFQPTFQYRFFPQSKSVANHGPNVNVDFFFDPEFSLRDRNTSISYSVSWVNRSRFSLRFEETYIKLERPFDPTNNNGQALLAESEYNWATATASFVSNQRSLLNYSLELAYGGFFNGNRFSTTSEVSYRVQPYGKFGIITTFDHIDLPLPYNSDNFLLFGPKLDLTFTDKLFLTTFTQYNNQINNINLNVRLQWRFASGSDFFIVYSQNSFPDDFVTKNRGLVGKLVYWFN